MSKQIVGIYGSGEERMEIIRQSAAVGLSVSNYVRSKLGLPVLERRLGSFECDARGSHAAIRKTEQRQKQSKQLEV